MRFQNKKQSEPAILPRVSWVYRGDTQGYHISVNGQQVHFTKDEYDRDMFIAELIAKTGAVMG